jgi:hypothetical protein
MSRRQGSGGKICGLLHALRCDLKPTNRTAVDRSKRTGCFKAPPVSLSEFNKTKAREHRRQDRKQSQLNCYQIINLIGYRKTASGKVSCIRTAIFILSPSAKFKLQYSNKLPAKLLFLLQFNTHCILSLILLFYFTSVKILLLHFRLCTS